MNPLVNFSSTSLNISAVNSYKVGQNNCILIHRNNTAGAGQRFITESQSKVFKKREISMLNSGYVNHLYFSVCREHLEYGHGL